MTPNQAHLFPQPRATTLAQIKLRKETALAGAKWKVA
jgi:hypothetical protein